MKTAGQSLSEPDAELNRLCEQVIGAAIEVHRVLGPGLLEGIYEEALCVEMTERRIAFTRQQAIDLRYKGREVGKGRLDFLVTGQLVVELKAVDALTEVHTAQVITYLKTTGKQLGLLINFNVSVLYKGIKRVVCSK